MTEPIPEYHANGTPIEPAVIPAGLTERAYNLARRLMALEMLYNRRARLTIDVLMIDGEWWLDVQKPGKLERLGE